MERGQTAWLGDVEPINPPPQPISHVLLLCPFLLMTHFLCPSAHFQAKSEKRKSRCMCICLEGVCLCVPVERESAHLGVVRGERRRRRRGLASVKVFLSPRGAGGEQGGESRTGAPQVSSTQPPLSKACQGGGSIQSLVNA